MAEVTLNLRPLYTLQDELCSRFVQRDAEVFAVLVGLVSGEPVLLVGEPGTAKTAIVESLAKMLDAKYFYYLLSRFTEPDELLGPVDVVALREGQYRRVTAGRLPEAHLVFLDEIFKSSTAVRNTLLDIVLHKRFLNGAHYVKLPMLALYTASNEVSHDSEDAAFYDRLTIRQFVRPVTQDAYDELLLHGVRLTYGNNDIRKVADVGYVEKLQSAARLVALAAAENASVRAKVVEAVQELEAKGIKLSDRRKIKIFIVAAAAALLAGSPTVSEADIMDALFFVAPREEGDEERVQQAVAKVFGDVADIPQKLLSMEAEVRNALRKLEEEKSLEAYVNLRQLLGEVTRKLKETGGVRPRYISYYQRLKRVVDDALRKLKEIEEGKRGEER